MKRMPTEIIKELIKEQKFSNTTEIMNAIKGVAPAKRAKQKR